MQSAEWKNSRGLMSESDGQIVRILRAPEMEALLQNVNVRDERGTNTRSRKWLQAKDITTNDVRTWLQTALFTGCRFGELVVVHKDPTLLFSPNKLRIPNYAHAKSKRRTKYRNIPLSNKGAEVIPDFFTSSELPSGNKNEVNQTLTSLSLILHAAAERIGLPKYDFELKVAKGSEYTDEKGKIRKEKVPVDYTTDGVCFRSFRKTWESWLMLSFANDYFMHMKLAKSMGHTMETSMQFYTTNLDGFDKQDKEDILPYVEGYGLIE